MRVRLKGIHVSYAKGRRYYYAWRGGPRLRGEPGSADFMASYHEAVAARKAPATGTLFTLIAAFKLTSEFTDLAPRTRADYLRHLKTIEDKYGRFPLAALPDRRTRGEFKRWRDSLATRSKRQADYAWVVLARVLSVAKDRGDIDVNPCEKGGRLYSVDRTDKVWTDEHETAFYAAAPQHLHLALKLALWTGQRQGDLLRLMWTNYDGTHIRLRQGKTGRKVKVKVGAPLKAALDAEKAKKRGGLILLTAEGERWTADGFRSSWRKACAQAGIDGLTFHDTRGTAVTRQFLAGATDAEVATNTGLSLADVRSILDAHYFNRDSALGDAGIAKLEARTNSTQHQQNGPAGSRTKG